MKVGRIKFDEPLIARKTKTDSITKPTEFNSVRTYFCWYCVSQNQQLVLDFTQNNKLLLDNTFTDTLMIFFQIFCVFIQYHKHWINAHASQNYKPMLGCSQVHRLYWATHYFSQNCLQNKQTLDYVFHRS